jgi:PKHD-type hydroxylase
VGGSVATESETYRNIRRSTISWVPINENTAWLYQRLAEVATKINDQYYGYVLQGLFRLQYTAYVHNEAGFYDWHIDTMGAGTPQRKLSFSMQLSDPMEYEGGELWSHGGIKTVMNKSRGIIHFFPSNTLHRVTPVTVGTRRSLVGWICGPHFR